MVLQISTQSVLEKTSNVLNKYEYCQLNNISIDTDIIVGQDETITFKNFYKGEELKNNGTCYHLMNKAYNELTVLYSQLGLDFTLLRCCGQDGSEIRGVIREFSSPLCKHRFLLFGENIPRLYEHQINCDWKEIDNFVTRHNEKLYIIDPSYNRIIKYSQSGYNITQLIGEYVTTPRYTDLVLPVGISIPFCRSNDGTLWFLLNCGKQAGLCFRKTFGYDFHSHRYYSLPYRLDDINLINQFPLNPEIINVIKILNSKLNP